MNRICSCCKVEKALEEFHKSKRHALGRKLECAKCTNEYLKNKYHTSTKLKSDFKQKRIDSYYKRKYNISFNDYLIRCNMSDFRCNICTVKKIPAGTSKKGSKDVLVLDHCHVTNKIRGVLCQNCNQALGLFKDNINTLTQAHLYLLVTETDKSDDVEEGY